MNEKDSKHTFAKIALIIIIATVVSSIYVQYKNCEYVGGTFVRGLFGMECISKH